MGVHEMGISEQNIYKSTSLTKNNFYKKFTKVSQKANLRKIDTTTINNDCKTKIVKIIPFVNLPTCGASKSTSEKENVSLSWEIV